MANVVEHFTKDGKRYFKIRIYRKSDHQYVSRNYYPPEGLNARNTKKALNNYIAELEREISSGTALRREDKKKKAQKEKEERAKIRTVKEYGESVYMPEITARSSENSRDSYQRTLNNYIYPAIGRIKLTDVTPAEINALILNVQETKSHSTALKVYTVAQGLFKSAYMSDLIEKNPMHKANRPKQSKDERTTEVETFSLDELKHIMKCVETEPLKWQAYIRTLIDTGMRRSEAVALHWDDINLTTGEIKVQRSATYTAKNGTKENKTKSGKIRTVYVSDKTLSILNNLKNDQDESEVVSIGSETPHYVFTQVDSFEMMSPQTPTRYFKKFGERHGIEGFHPHKLRHSFASNAIINGADIASVSEILGHYDKSLTLRVYTHADEEARKRASTLFQDLLKEGSAEG